MTRQRPTTCASMTLGWKNMSELVKKVSNPTGIRTHARHALVSRRHVLVSTAALLAGCGESSLGLTVASATRLTIGVDVPIKRSAVDNVPYATLGARIGRGPRGMLVLWAKEGSDLTWYSVDNVALVTRAGRVVRTAGLPENIRATRHLSPDPVALGLHRETNLIPWKREIDSIPELGYGMVIESAFRQRGAEKITIAEIEFDTIHVVERNVATTLSWTFENHYWVDPEDGFVWKSRQFIARAFGSIEIEILRPAA